MYGLQRVDHRDYDCVGLIVVKSMPYVRPQFQQCENTGYCSWHCPDEGVQHLGFRVLGGI